MSTTRRRGRPLNPDAAIADARSVVTLAEESLLRGTREMLVLVNQSLRDLRAVRDELDTAA